ncbi:MAG: hypothetical protein IPJ26_14915 [Bacteroidetes bacterium]|nr:hypothetical protein [Bacteroidota bacterium]
MLIRSFRTTQIFPLVILVILSATMWFVSKSGTYEIVARNGMPLYDLIVSALTFIPPSLSVFLAFLLFTSQAIHINHVINKHEVLYKQSWLPALMFIIIAGLFPPFLWIHPILFVNSLLIFVFDKLFSLYKHPAPLALSFDGAFLLSLAALFYLPTIFLFLFYILCILILRPFSWRLWTVSIMGLLLPFFFAFFYYFWNNELMSFYERVFVSGIKRQIDLAHIFNVKYILSVVIVGILFILSLLKLQTNYFKNVTKSRLIQQLLVLLIPIGILSVLFSRDESLYRYSIIVLPVSIYLAYYFLSGKKRWVMEVMFLLLCAGWIYNYFVI